MSACTQLSRLHDSDYALSLPLPDLKPDDPPLDCWVAEIRKSFARDCVSANETSRRMATLKALGAGWGLFSWCAESNAYFWKMIPASP